VTQPVPDRLTGSMRRINRALNPRDVYAVTWEYQVILAKPGPPVTIDCEAIDTETTAVLPLQIVGLVLWPGPSGFVAVPAPGTIVRIGFVNADPGKPFVAGLDPNGTPTIVYGFATVIQLGDATATPVTPTTWAAALAVALTTFSAAMFAAATGPLTPMAAPAAALNTAVGALPPAATTKVLAK
jgi:hypothetical protein